MCRSVFSEVLRILPVRLTALLLPFLLAACAGGGGTGRSWHGRLQCAPWAREHSAIALRGSASSWWAGARGLYPRASQPQSGSVLVFRSSSRLPDGHVSVVRAVRGPRAILVDQANWNPGRVDHAVPVVDVSPANDWTRVRVWWSATGSMGRTVYPTWGFILPARREGWIS
ncbi:CHAP domain-containing protein [Acetobacter musti]|uniref:CHAP domain-containing protein n=1 Tax=Acetobacter musti TaxID=864732 RepID=A0ABX0JKZ2_9PROT|nr:CHAP domain-containing protein [Acetobacter musti]NHN83517.1 CHAP domain-containing protein [Acetobacter musti]